MAVRGHIFAGVQRSLRKHIQPAEKGKISTVDLRYLLQIGEKYLRVNKKERKNTLRICYLYI